MAYVMVDLEAGGPNRGVRFSTTVRSVAFVAVALLLLFQNAAAQSQDMVAEQDLHQYLGSGYPAEERGKVLTHLKSRSDNELEVVLDLLLQEPGFRRLSGYEPCLTEIIRRGGERWKDFLKRKLDHLESSELKLGDESDELEPGSYSNLELRTALRRVSNQPDPLQITFSDPAELAGIGAALPVIAIAIRNRDIDQSNIGFTFGGGYRSGRQTRWRILAQDSNGKCIPVRGNLSMVGGGQYTEGLLEFDRAWETTLDVRSYIEVPPPGEYSLTIQYHNTHDIADESDIDGLIVASSKSVPLTVKPLTIVHNRKDQEAVRSLVEEIDVKTELKVVAGTYGEWAHEFVPPESPEARLLEMGLKATPMLIELLRDEHTTHEKRARIFSILFSITSENDPRIGSVLGNFEYRESGWQLWGRRSGGGASGGISVGSRGSRWGATIDPEAQEKLIEAWDGWLKRVDLQGADFIDRDNEK